MDVCESEAEKINDASLQPYWDLIDFHGNLFIDFSESL